MKTQCPNEAYNIFINLYREAFDQAFPLISTKIHNTFIKREPWITSGLLTSCRTKGKLLKKQLNKPTELNLIAYTHFLQHYNKLKRIMKQNYYQSMLWDASLHPPTCTKTSYLKLESTLSICV